MLEDFFFLALELKNIRRKGWQRTLGLKNPESVADHSYLVTIMAMVFAQNQKLDVSKIIKMSLLHDIAEVKIGDLTPEDITRERKIILENNAMKDILSTLQPDLSNEYNTIWKEFQEKKSKESILLHEIDKLEMVFQAKKYLTKSNKNEIQTFLDTAKNEIHNEELKTIFNKII